MCIWTLILFSAFPHALFRATFPAQPLSFPRTTSPPSRPSSCSARDGTLLGQINVATLHAIEELNFSSRSRRRLRSGKRPHYAMSSCNCPIVYDVESCAMLPIYF
ncbi:hypothetical protein B0H14DRAFT_23194 [Mycena olivaceomarginata]|nr:hypothetical protein B0H14DRAFT_23194 [Mycena olivaceomarginata]